MDWFARGVAEECGGNQGNVDGRIKSHSTERRRFLGVKNSDGSAAGVGTGIGLDEDWIGHIVKAVGNYGEGVERNLGASTNMKIVKTKGKNFIPSLPAVLLMVSATNS